MRTISLPLSGMNTSSHFPTVSPHPYPVQRELWSLSEQELFKGLLFGCNCSSQSSVCGEHGATLISPTIRALWPVLPPSPDVCLAEMELLRIPSWSNHMKLPTLVIFDLQKWQSHVGQPASVWCPLLPFRVLPQGPDLVLWKPFCPSRPAQPSLPNL